MPISFFNLLETETDIRTLRKNLTSMALTTIVAVSYHYSKNLLNDDKLADETSNFLLSYFQTTGIDITIGILSLCVCYLSTHYFIILLTQLTTPVIQYYTTHVLQLNSQLEDIYGKYSSTNDPKSYHTYRNDFDPDDDDGCNESPADYYCKKDRWYALVFQKKKVTSRKLSTINLIALTLTKSKTFLLIIMPLAVAGYALIIAYPFTIKFFELLPKLLPS